MWLYIPSRFVPASVGSTSESPVLSILASSVTLSGNFRLLKYWLQKWKKGGLTKLRSTLILPASTVSRGVERWVSSLPDCRASRLALRESGAVSQMRDTSGPCSSELSRKCNPPWYLSKMSQVSLSGFDRSETNYADWVISLRLDSSQRKKLVLAISGNGSSVWPTAQAFDSVNAVRTQAEWVRRNAELKAKNPNLGELQKSLGMIATNWPTPTASQMPNSDQRIKEGRLDNIITVSEKWSTPLATAGGEYDRSGPQNLKVQVETFHPDPMTMKLGENCWCESLGCGLLSHKRRLNPWFVEALMGFSVGWTAQLGSEPLVMPSSRHKLPTHSSTSLKKQTDKDQRSTPVKNKTRAVQRRLL